ncbi:MAG: cell division protein FtsA [Candidatus Solibacter sp.]|jgi:cell division protein FtsA|nr:cell division protein FtsA [Candidatus Solibacter sp.]
MAAKTIYAAGLDLGSRQTRLVICTLENGHVRFLGAGEAESQGWSKGRIADQQAVSGSVTAALREVEARAGASIESAVVGMGGPTVRGANGRGILELGYVQEIQQKDVNRVFDRASRVQLMEDRMVLQLFPQDFVVDDHPGHRDPRKMLASRLEVNVHLVTASIQEHNAIIGAVNTAHLAVEETVYEALASCYAAVLPENRREGIAVVDIGSHSTELVIYYGDAMHLASTVRICGDHFTRDLAQGLCLSFEDAELVKMEFGCAVSRDCPDNIAVELPTPEDRQPREVQRKIVNRIIEARAEELFRFVRGEFARVGLDRSLIGGVFLTGAGAKMPGLCDAAEEVLQCQTRFGLTEGIMDWPAEFNDPAWCTAAGLAMYSAKLKEQAELQKEQATWIGKILK